MPIPGDELQGGAGDDILFGGGGTDTYIFRVGDGADFLYEEVEAEGTSIINLRFEGNQYEADDFKEDRTSGDPLFTRNGRHLVIAIDKNTSDGITDKVTIANAFDTDNNLLYTINVGYDAEGSFNQVATADAYWNSLGD